MAQEQLTFTSAERPTYASAAGYMAVDYELALQRVVASDSSEIYHMVNDDRDFLSRTLEWAKDYSRTRADEEFRHIDLDAQAGRRAPYKVIYQGKPVGFVNLHSRIDDRAQLGYWLKNTATGKGLMTRATQGMRDYGFSQWGLDRIDLHIKPSNRKSLAVAERLGASLIGMTRNSNSGRPTTYEVWSISKDEW